MVAITAAAKASAPISARAPLSAPRLITATISEIT
jgi:hypothetical protein